MKIPGEGNKFNKLTNKLANQQIITTKIYHVNIKKKRKFTPKYQSKIYIYRHCTVFQNQNCFNSYISRIVS